MLDAFLGAAYEKKQASDQEQALGRAMRALPVGELYKLAIIGGKTANSHEGDLDWLEHFKGTPLMEQAIGLSQEGIQMEMAEKQQGEQSRAMWDMRDQICMKKRLLNIQLAQYEQQQLGGSATLPTSDASAPTPPGSASSPASATSSSVPAPTPGGPTADMGQPPGTPKSVTVKMSSMKVAGEPGELTLGEKLLAFGPGNIPGYFGAKKGKENAGEGVEGYVRGTGGWLGGGALGTVAGSFAGRALGGNKGELIGGGLGALAGGVGGYKLLTRKYDEPSKEAAVDIMDAVSLGQELARSDAEKIAGQRAAIDNAQAMGRLMAKQALAPGSFGTFLNRAADVAAQNSGALIGAGVGAVGGAAAAGEGNRMAGALGGGLGGAALGHGVQHVGGAVAGGVPVGEAFSHYGQGLKASAGRAVDAVRNKFKPPMAGTVNGMEVTG